MPPHAKILLVLIYIARQLLLVRARVVKSVDTADLKSADSKKSCRFDSGLGHQVFNEIYLFIPFFPNAQLVWLGELRLLCLR